MKRCIMSAIFAASLVAALAAEAKTPQRGPNPNPDPDEVIKIGDRTMTRREAHELSQKVRYQFSGGTVRRAGTAKGFFALVNSQSVVPAADLSKAVETIDRQARIQVKTVSVAGVTAANAKDEIAKASAQIGVVVVNSPDLPALLGAPEEGWGMVNVAKLGGEGVDAAKLAARTRREILRAFALAAGALYAVTGDFVLQPIKSPDGLDRLLREDYGVAILNVFPRTLPTFGVSPAQQASYINAIRQGWAPAPTNDVQKAIWDKVHAMPTEPIKIKPETKKVEK